MNVELRNAKRVARPVSDYSHVAIVPSGARLRFVSGQLAIDQDGALAGKGDAVRQAGQILESILDLRRRALAGHAPASTAVEVRRLAHPDWLVEIDCVTAIDG